MSADLLHRSSVVRQGQFVNKDALQSMKLEDWQVLMKDGADMVRADIHCIRMIIQVLEAAAAINDEVLATIDDSRTQWATVHF